MVVRTLNTAAMDCREFREKHFAFVDDTLSGIEVVGLQMHLNECERCARQDAIVRRSLMALRSLPCIEPSPGFSEKLQKRLEEARAADLAASHLVRSRKFAAVVMVTSVVMLGYIALSLKEVDAARHIMLPPVVATLPDSDTASMTTPAPAMVAAVPAGLPIWTAAMFAEQAPVHFASTDLLLTSATR
ncbi:MAG: zf-HC2 domain-containing protein [Gemmatimonadaceae bacterium]|nr:zf-HC2 domain-containing protein [Gemmatimonadaceae bacterium]